MRKFNPAVLSALIGFFSLVVVSSSSFAQNASPVPAPWSSQDIGNPVIAGNATESSGTFTITAAGTDIGGKSDQFHFVYQTLTGDGEVRARVNSVTAAHVWSKAGVMMREALAGNSKHASVLASAAKGVAYQRRVSAGGSTTSTAGTTGAPPRWLRIVRKGNTFEAYESPDGQTWQSIGTSTISMAQTIYVGLAATSHKASATTTASLSNVAVATAEASNQPPAVSLTSPTDGATFTDPATIALSASASDADGTVAGVDFYRGTTLIGSDNSSPYSVSWSNVPAGTYSLSARARDNAGATTTSSSVDVTVSDAAPSLPAPWQAQDIGNPAIAGSASESTGTFTVAGAGVDIWDTSDQFQYAYQLFTGDGEIVAKVNSLTPTNDWSKAGVMLRETLDANARHALIHISPANGVRFLRRSTTGGTTTSTPGAGVTAPYWVRLVRRGDTFEGYASPDGTTWTLVGSATIAMNSTVYAGLAVGSVDATAAATGTFSNVSVTEGTTTNQPPALSLTSPTDGASFTAPANLTLAANATDSDGTVARVDFYAGSTLVGSDTSAPYSVSWSNVPAGSYTLTAVATDDDGDSTRSGAVGITVKSSTNTQPTVSITSPASGSSFAAPTTISLSASASDADGSVTKVDFYAGTTLIGSDSTSPYTIGWANAAPGTYAVTAKATDNAGAVTTSASVTVTLRPTQAAFTASADHDTLVVSYRLDIFASNADPNTATPLATRDLGKPAPVNGEITVDITTTLQPLAAGTYTATVSAVGSSGASRSAAATFTR